jgi:hypothetical protein
MEGVRSILTGSAVVQKSIHRTCWDLPGQANCVCVCMCPSKVCTEWYGCMCQCAAGKKVAWPAGLSLLMVLLAR